MRHRRRIHNQGRRFPLFLARYMLIGFVAAMVFQVTSAMGQALTVLAINGEHGGSFSPGQSWRVSLSGAAPRSPFSLCTLQIGSRSSCTPGLTDAAGTWSLTGEFTLEHVGAWMHWVQFDTGKITNRILFTVGEKPMLNLTINNNLTGTFNLGQPWTLTLTGAPANAPFSLCTEKDGAPNACTAGFGMTDSNGQWTLSGSFNTLAIAEWKEWLVFANGRTTNPLRFTVTDRALVSFTINNTNGDTYSAGTPWSLRITGAPPQTPFALCLSYNSGPEQCLQNFGITDATGAWLRTGTFRGTDLGTWTEYVRFPSAVSNRVSLLVTFPAYRFATVNFGPYFREQDPNTGIVIGEEQLRQRLALIAPFTDGIRSYGVTNGLEHVVRIAREFGLTTAIGAWLSTNAAANDRELQHLIGLCQQGLVDIAVVGSETLLRSDLTEQQLLQYVARLRAAAPGVILSTADTYNTLLQHPAVVGAVDVVFANIFPYWEGRTIGEAIARLHAAYNELQQRYPQKPIVVGETGWPSGGNTTGQAVPSPENSARYALNFISWARALQSSYYYFAAFDEAWKARYEGPQGATWGVFTEDGNLKPGMQDVLDGKQLPDNWTPQPTPPSACPASAAKLRFTTVPAYGSRELLRGQACGVTYGEYGIVVYIKVGAGYWVKPFANQSVTAIAPDGTFATNIVSGGIDDTATEIVAYLIPKTFAPPILLGASTIPPTVDQTAAAKVSVTRTPPCTYTINPTARALLAASTTGSVAVTTGAGCAWSATSNTAWITITADATSSGSGTVTYGVTANTGTASRTGTLTIAGKMFTIEQTNEGIPCGPNPDISYGMTLTCSFSTGGSTVFRFPGAVGGQITIATMARSGPYFEPCIELVRPNNSRARACGLNYTHRIDETLSQAGVFSIIVSDDAAALTGGDYTLALERRQPPTTPERLAYGTIHQNELTPVGDHDVLAFEGRAGLVIRATVASLGGVNFNPCIELTPPSGERVTACSLEASQTIDRSLFVTGAYTLMVYDNAGAPTTGKYSLTMQCIGGTCAP